jgi:hypothetical protein
MRQRAVAAAWGFTEEKRQWVTRTRRSNPLYHASNTAAHRYLRHLIQTVLQRQGLAGNQRLQALIADIERVS